MGYVILLWHSLSLPYNYFVYFAITVVIMKKKLPGFSKIGVILLSFLLLAKHYTIFYKDNLGKNEMRRPVSL